MKKYGFYCLVSLFLGLSLCGQDVVKELQYGGGGTFHAEKLNFRLAAILGNYQSPAFLPEETGKTDEKYTFQCPLTYRDKKGTAVLAVLREQEDTWRFSGKIQIPDSWMQYIGFEFPVRQVAYILYTSEDNRARRIEIPENKGPQFKLLSDVKTKNITVVMKDGERYFFLDYPGGVFIQDNRNWQDMTISVRFYQSEGAFSVAMRREETTQKTVPLATVANGYRHDEVGGDHKGGWTDQGQDNDLRLLKPGSYSGNGMTFLVADESAGPATVILAGGNRSFGPHEIDIPLPPNEARAIALLHTSAWTPAGKNPVGEMDVFYKDTGIQTIPILASRDVGDWWSPRDISNGKVIWKGINQQTQVGIYASCFPVSGKGPTRLRLRVTNADAAWMILGITLLSQPVTIDYRAPGEPLTAKADKDWLPIDFSFRAEPGGPFDFSFINRDLVPAGKWGHVIASPQGTFTFQDRPDKQLRILGTNLVDKACFLDKKVVDDLVPRLKAMGINGIRIHQADEYLISMTPGPMCLNTEKVDQLDYLIAKCKENGIYITTDLFLTRQLREGELSEVRKKYPKMSIRHLLTFTDEGLANWEEFVRLWLTHKNPYTGMTLAEDPVLAFVNLLNEDNVFNFFMPWDEQQYTLLAELYRKYAADNHIPDLRILPGNMDFVAFVCRLHLKRLKTMEKFLREDLNCRTLVTSCNFNGNRASTLLRSHFDVIDEHANWGHPSFPEVPWSMPCSYNQASVIGSGCHVPVSYFAGMVYGKPFTMTELNFNAPNVHRAEGAAIIGAYGALQDMAGFFRFNYSCYPGRVSGERMEIVPFEAVYDPIMNLSDRLIAAMYLRGDVQTAKTKLSYPLSDAFFGDGAGLGFPWIRSFGLLTRIGAAIPGLESQTQDFRNPPPEIKKRFDAFEKTGIAVSETDEIVLNTGKNTMTVNTPKTVCLVLSGEKSLTAGPLSVREANTIMTTGVISLTDAPVSQSDNSVLLMLTDVLATGDSFETPELLLQYKAGVGGPLLLRHGRANVSLRVNGPRNVYALNLAGKRVGKIPADYRNGLLSFTMDNGAFAGGIFGYHIVKE